MIAAITLAVALVPVPPVLQKGGIDITPVAALVLDGLELCSPRVGGCVERAVKRQLRVGTRSGILIDNEQRAAVASAIFGVTASRARLARLLASTRQRGRSQSAGATALLSPERRRRSADVQLLALFLLHGSPQRIESHTLTRVIDPAHLGLPVAELDRLRSLGEVRWPAAPVPRIALQHSLPTGLVREWASVLASDEVEALAMACARAGPVTLRANICRCTRDELSQRLHASGVETRDGVLSPLALHLKGGRSEWGRSIWSMEAWREGWFEVQDEGSQCVVQAAEVRPGEAVLDLCAGNGGKTLALAAAVGERGHVVAHDVAHARLRALGASAERAGVSARVELLMGEASAQGEARLRQRFLHAPPDVVLVDAPCSSSGVIRRHPGLRWSKQWAPGSNAAASAAELPGLQLRLLRQAAALLPPGGRLCFATCALERTQNEQVAAAFEQDVGTSFTPWPFRETSADQDRAGGARPESPFHFRTLWPHTHGTDGFFIARWVRSRA